MSMNNPKAPAGAMSSPFSGIGSGGMFDVIGTKRIEPFTDAELDQLIPKLAEVCTPVGKTDENRAVIADICGMRVRITKE